MLSGIFSSKNFLRLERAIVAFGCAVTSRGPKCDPNVLMACSRDIRWSTYRPTGRDGVLMSDT